MAELVWNSTQQQPTTSRPGSVKHSQTPDSPPLISQDEPPTVGADLQEFEIVNNACEDKHNMQQVADTASLTLFDSLTYSPEAILPQVLKRFCHLGV